MYAIRSYYGKAAAKVQASIFKHQQAEQEIAFLYALVNNLTIFAPEDGMVIYRKDNMGEKAGKDASVDAWNPIVAELPDMNRMSSKTFVNEVDIQKIRNNQEVEVSFDAFPSKNIKGHITEVANVGETIFGGNAKVFLVKIALDRITSYNVCYTKLLRRLLRQLKQRHLKRQYDIDHCNYLYILLLGVEHY